MCKSTVRSWWGDGYRVHLTVDWVCTVFFCLLCFKYSSLSLATWIEELGSVQWDPPMYTFLVLPLVVPRCLFVICFGFFISPMFKPTRKYCDHFKKYYFIFIFWWQDIYVLVERFRIFGLVKIIRFQIEKQNN